MKEFRYAYTLAEVLITLAIIGVVAVMTIPSLVKNYRRHVLETQFKHSVSILDSAVKLMVSKDINPEEVFSFRNNDFDKFYQNFMGKIEDIQKIQKNSNKFIYKNYSCNENIPKQFHDFRYPYQLNSGETIMMDVTTSLGQSGWEESDLIITIDINGYKNRPNCVGKDLFFFFYDKNGILPVGYSDDNPPKFYKSTFPGFPLYFNHAFNNSSDSNNHEMLGSPFTYDAIYDKNYFKNLQL